MEYRLKSGRRLLRAVTHLAPASVACVALLFLSACSSQPVAVSPTVEGAQTASPAAQDAQHRVLNWDDLQVENIALSAAALPEGSQVPTPEDSKDSDFLPGKAKRTVETDPDHGRVQENVRKIEINPAFPFDSLAHSFVWVLQEQGVGKYEVQVKLGSSAEIAPKPLAFEIADAQRIRLIQGVATTDRLYALFGDVTADTMQLWTFFIGNDGSLRSRKIADFSNTNVPAVPKSAPHPDATAESKVKKQALKIAPSLVLTRGSLYISAQRGARWVTERFPLNAAGEIGARQQLTQASGPAEHPVRLFPAGDTSVGFVLNSAGRTQFGRISDGAQPEIFLSLRLAAPPLQVRMLGEALLLRLDAAEAQVRVIPAASSSSDSPGTAAPAVTGDTAPVATSAETTGTLETPPPTTVEVPMDASANHDPVVGEISGAKSELVFISVARRQAVRLFPAQSSSLNSIGIVQAGFMMELKQLGRVYRFLLKPEVALGPWTGPGR